MLAYGYFEKQTIANFLPTFILNGNDGYAFTKFHNMFIPFNLFWNYGLNFMQPIFDYKLRRSEYERAKYQFDSSILIYKDTVMKALQEVNNNLLSYKRDFEALRYLRSEVNNSRDKLQIANAQYKSGYGDYATYLTYELTLLQNSYNLTNQQLLMLQDVVQIYKTLGLGLDVTVLKEKELSLLEIFQQS